MTAAARAGWTGMRLREKIKKEAGIPRPTMACVEGIPGIIYDVQCFSSGTVCQNFRKDQKLIRNLNSYK